MSTTDFPAVAPVEEEDDIPEATYATDPYGFFEDNPHPPGPTQADKEDDALVAKALAADPGWDRTPPPMYLPDSARYPK